jgi:hypothetical protein
VENGASRREAVLRELVVSVTAPRQLPRQLWLNFFTLVYHGNLASRAGAPYKGPALRGARHAHKETVMIARILAAVVQGIEGNG